MKKIRIGLVDDKAVNRDTIAGKIAPFDTLDLCFIANSGIDCMGQLKTLPANDLPQLIFMDLEMPGLSGIETISQARELYPDIFFVVLTVFDDDDKLFEAIKAGAHGYLLKDEPAASLEKAVMTVVEHGGSPMSPAIARKTLNMLSKIQVQLPVSENTDTGKSLEKILTEREKEILLYTINGYDAKRIAETLVLSIHTVRKHISNIYEKLHVTNKGQAIQVAYKTGLV